VNLTGDDLRAAYYCVAEVVRSRRRTGASIPGWMKIHFDRLDTAVRLSPTRQAVAENGGRAPQSAHGIIGTAEAAAILGWSTRRVQREAGQLGGARVCGRLLFLRETIADYARRGGS
jgi:hypothetical protein